MNKYIKKALCVILSGAFVLSLSGCSEKAEKSQIDGLFTDLSKISYSQSYKELSAKKTNKVSKWRHGMVSGNGCQGFVESGSPYSDTFIFQNMYFIMPNQNVRYCPETYNELETVKQSIVKGEDITDNASYDDVYRYHAGGQLRIDLEGGGEKNYLRYTDYETSQVGVHYKNNENGRENRLPQWQTVRLLPSLPRRTRVQK